MRNMTLNHMILSNQLVRIDDEIIDIAIIDFIYFNHDTPSESAIKKRNGEYLVGTLDISYFQTTIRKKLKWDTILFIKVDSLLHSL